MLANKVVKMDNESTVIYNHVQNFFKDLNKKNRDYEVDTEKRGTIRAYNGDIRLFFRLMRGKQEGFELETLTLNDIKISQDDFENYIDTLCDLKKENGKNKYVNKTINRKITALKSFIRFMKKKKVLSDFDISYIELIKGEKERKVHYGALEPEEVVKMSDLAWETEREKGDIKRLLILTSFKTGLRIGELLSLKWKNFIEINGDVIIQGIGKGNKEYEIKVTSEFFKEITTLNNGQDKVFNISEDAFSNSFSRIRDKMQLPKERRIVFHSVRKCFGTMIWRLTNDIEMARRALRHESVATTQIYLGINHYEIQDVVFMADKIDDDLYKKVNKEDLISAISNCPTNVKLILNMKLQELLKK